MAATASTKIYAELRQQVGGNSGRRLRRQGKLPAVLYGHAQQPLHLQLDEAEFRKHFRHVSENSLIDLICGGEHYRVLVKDYSIDLLKDRLIHIDLCKVVAGHLLKTHVPLHFVGSAAGVKMGGLVEHNLHELLVECLPKDLPTAVEVNISGLQLAQSLHVRDLVLPAGVVALVSGEQLVVNIAVPRGMDVGEPAAPTPVEPPTVKAKPSKTE